jgi:hypothetical protein
MAGWRVQATWTVDGEERSYAPVFARTRSEAEREQRDMEQTLAHFPTLVVTIEPATDEERDEETSRLEAAASITPHLKFRYDDRVTACGLPAETIRAWSLPEIYEQISEDTRCPGCAQALAGD